MKDKVSPSLVVTTPKKGSSHIALNQDLMLIFDENIRIGTGNIVISNDAGDVQTISLLSSPNQYSLIGKTLVIKPARDFLPNNHYSVKIDNNAITDLSGNKYAGFEDAMTLYFDTIDTIKPVLSKTNLDAKKTGIASTDNIVLTFNEKIQSGKGNITLVTDDDSRTISIGDKQITFSGNTLIINPLIDLNVNSLYKLHIEDGALGDLALTPNLVSAIDLSFKTIATGDKQAPILQQYSGKGEVGDNLQLEFQEPIKIGKGNFTLNDGTTQTLIPVTDTAQVSFQNNILTINPAQNLNPEKIYTLKSPKGIVSDLAGNALTALSGKNVFTFDTHDKTSPTLTITDDKNTIANSHILYTFTLSEASNDFMSDDIVISGGTKGIFTSLNPSTYTLLVTPNADSITPITVDVRAGVFRDLVGNNNVAALQNVQLIDTNAPTVTISADNVLTINSPVTYTFSLSEASQTFNVDSITVSGAEKGVFTALSPTEYTLNITPNANSITPVIVEVSPDTFTDIVGNGNSASEKSSQAVDTLAPTLIGTTPVNQSTNVVKSSNIALFFNENIRAGKGDFVISNGSDTQTISVNDATQVFINNKIVTLNPSKDLIANTEYSVTFSEGVITDKSGNAFTGLTLPTQFTLKIQADVTTTKDTASQTQSFVDKLKAKALDGYLKGATVFADKNGNGIQDPDESSAITDDYGNFELENPKGSLIVSGGTDLSTGKAFAGTLRAPEGSTVVTPLTTVQQGFIDAGQSPDQAEKSVAKAFGFDAETVELTSYDPIAEIVKTDTTSETQSIATQIMASSAQIANFLVTTSQVLQGAAGGSDNLSQENASHALVKSLVNRVLNDEPIDNGRVDLANSTLLKAVIVGGAKEVRNLASTQESPAFDGENFIVKMDKMAGTLTEVLKSAADNISTAVTNRKEGNGLALLGNLDKVSSFVQNNAGQSLQNVAVRFDIKNPNAIDAALKAQAGLFTGDVATKAINNMVVDTQKSVGDIIAADAAAKRAIEEARIAAEKAAIEKAAAEQKAINDARIAAEQAAIEKAAAEQKAINDAKIEAEKARLQAIEDARDRTPPTITLNGSLITDTGLVTSIQNNDVTKDNTIGLSGYVSDNVSVSSVQIYDGTTVLAGGATIANGSWNYVTPTLSEGVHTFKAIAVDSSGNSNFSNSISLTVDITPDAAPAIFNLSAADDTGAITTDNITKKINGLRIHGTGVNGSSVQLYTWVDANNNSVIENSELITLGSATRVAVTGAFSIDVNLAEGVNNIVAKQTDTAGNVSAASSVLQITVDTLPPDKPTTREINTYSDTTIQITSNLTDTIKVYVDNILTPATYNSTEGTLTFQNPLKDGDNTITYTLTDAAGNESVSSDSMNIHVIRKVTIDHVSNVNQPLVIEGRAEPNANVALQLNSNVTVNVNADQNGNWIYDGNVRYIMIRKTLQPLQTSALNFDANGIFTVGDVSIYDKFGNLVPTSTISVLSSSGFTGEWDPTKVTGSLLDDNHIKSTSFSEAWGKDINSTAGGEAWIQFNLGSSYTLSEITVFARDSFGARLNNAQIFTSVNDMSEKSTFQLNADPNVNVISPINNLVNFSYDDLSIPVQKVDFQFSLQNITATETVSSLSNSTNATVINGTSSGDSISGASGADFIFGGQGNDLINGGDGLDNIQGGEGSDLINGGSGDDFITGGQGSDTIDGGADYDMISYRHFDYQNPSGIPSVGVTVNLLTGTATDNWGNTDTLLSIEEVEGSDLSDSLIGGSGDDVLLGGQGNDSVSGGLEDDFISGDQGDDTLIGDEGSDHIRGGEGSDLIIGSSGDDFLSGDLGVDTLTGGDGNDIFMFNLGSHSISSSNLTDVITDFASGSDKMSFDIPSTGIQFVSNTTAVSDIATLLLAVDSKNNEESNKTDQKILFYFGVIALDGYLVTESDTGLISNIIKLSGVTTIASTDILGL